MDNDEWTKLIQSEEVKRNRSVIRRIARNIDQIDGSSSGELLSHIESMLEAREIALAVHTLRLAYDECGIEHSEIRGEIVLLIERYRAALVNQFQCKYDLDAQ